MSERDKDSDPVSRSRGARGDPHPPQILVFILGSSSGEHRLIHPRVACSGMSMLVGWVKALIRMDATLTRYSARALL